MSEVDQIQGATPALGATRQDATGPDTTGSVATGPGAPRPGATERAPTGPGRTGSDAVTRAASGVVRELTGLVDRIAAFPTAADDAERIDRIAALERLRGAVAAAQARETVEFAASQLAAQRTDGVPASRQGRGISEQIGLARRMSPAAAARQVTLARAWATDLPDTFTLLRSGHISEWVASIVARETTVLDPGTRRLVDSDLAPDLPTMSPPEAEAAARRHCYQADPVAALSRSRNARADRRVGIRPAPDTMATLTGYLPVEQGVATYAALDRHARALKANGDTRSIGQLRADTLVERVTGQSTADAVPVEIGLIMTADSLLGDDHTPAHLQGHGPIPAELARDLATGGDTLRTRQPTTNRPIPEPTTWIPAPDPTTLVPTPSAPTTGSTATTTGSTAAPADGTLAGMSPPEALVVVTEDEAARAAVWIRRLHTDPIDYTVLHVDTRRRRFDGALARLIRYRDQTCRDLYCTAAIRHLDHIHPHRDGGPTTAANGAGLCERANYVKEMPGWTRQVTDSGQGGGGQRITVTTPTGHTYTSTPPPALGPGSHHTARSRRRDDHLRFEDRQRDPLITTIRYRWDPDSRTAISRPPDPPRRQ